MIVSTHHLLKTPHRVAEHYGESNNAYAAVLAMDGVSFPSSAVDISLNTQGTLLASIHADDALKIWDRNDRESWDVIMQLRCAHREGAVSSICWAPPVLSPALLATVGSDAVLAFYRLPPSTTSVEVNAVAAQTLQVCHARGPLTAMCFADDGMLATFGEENIVRIYCCDPIGFANESWTLLAAIDIGRQPGSGISFKPGTSRVLCAGGVLVSRGKEAWDYKVHSELESSDITCVDWGQGELVGVGREDGGVEIWQLSSRKHSKVAELYGDKMGKSNTKVLKLSWDRSGEILASTHSDGRTYVWTRKISTEEGSNDSWPWYLRDAISVIG